MKPTDSSHKHSSWAQVLLSAAIATLLAGCAAPSGSGTRSSLREALTFHASFDEGVDADFASGDPRLYSATSMKQPRVGTPGLPASGYATVVRGEGVRGDALRFHRKVGEMTFYQAAKNVPYKESNWSGTVSFWLRLTPEEDLQPGYTDPIQITPRDWNDAAFFVEFTPENPRHFQLGAYADFKVWNPDNKAWDKMSFEEKPLLRAPDRPFSRDRWTHVAFAFENFNTGQPNGTVRLYLDGKSQGLVGPRKQTFTWDPEKTLVMLGLSFVGYFDELSLFSRALSEAEIRALFELTNGVRDILPRQ